MKRPETCPHCNQTMMVYKRAIRRNMIPGLILLSDGLVRRTSELGLSLGARSDFTTLRYFGLIYKPYGEDKDKWAITQAGRDFITNNLSIWKYVYVFNGHVEGRSDEQIYISDITPERFEKQKLLEEAIPKFEFNPEDVL